MDGKSHKYDNIISWKEIPIEERDYAVPSNINIRRILVGNKMVDHSDVVWASPVGAVTTTSSGST